MARLACVGAALSVLLLAPGHAIAHAGGEPRLVVPLEVAPGDRFTVYVLDLGARTDVSVDLADPKVHLGDARTDGYGHVTRTFTLPRSIPKGSVRLVAQGADGSAAATALLVGNRTTAAPPPAAADPWWRDPSLVLLLVVVVGGAAALAVLALRARRTKAAAGR